MKVITKKLITEVGKCFDKLWEEKKQSCDCIINPVLTDYLPSFTSGGGGSGGDSLSRLPKDQLQFKLHQEDILQTPVIFVVFFIFFLAFFTLGFPKLNVNCFLCPIKILSTALCQERNIEVRTPSSHVCDNQSGWFFFVFFLFYETSVHFQWHQNKIIRSLKVGNCISSCVCGDRSRYFKSKKDLTKWFLCPNPTRQQAQCCCNIKN